MKSGRLRAGLAAILSLGIGVLIWPIALEHNANIEATDFDTLYLLIAVGIGAGLVAVAGRRNRSLFCLWTLLFIAGQLVNSLFFSGPLEMRRIVEPTMAFFTIFMFIGTVTVVLLFDICFWLSHKKPLHIPE